MFLLVFTHSQWCVPTQQCRRNRINIWNIYWRKLKINKYIFESNKSTANSVSIQCIRKYVYRRYYWVFFPLAHVDVKISAQGPLTRLFRSCRPCHSDPPQQMVLSIMESLCIYNSMTQMSKLHLSAWTVWYGWKLQNKHISDITINSGIWISITAFHYTQCKCQINTPLMSVVVVYSWSQRAVSLA